MSRSENFRDAIRIAFGFLKHGKLIGPDGLVDAGFHVPAGEVAAKGAGESAGAKTADGRTLPKTVVDMAGVEGRLFRARVLEGLADGTLPSSLGDVVVGMDAGGEQDERKRYNAGKREALDHKDSSMCMAGKRFLAGPV